MADENKCLEKGKMLQETKMNENERFLKIKMDDSKIEFEHPSKQKYGGKLCRVVIGFLITINIFLMVTLLALVFIWRANRFEKLEPREHTICVLCSDMGLDGDNLPKDVERNNSTKATDGVQKSECCGIASVILDKMVSKAIKDREAAIGSGMQLFETKECKKTTKEVPSAQMNGISIAKIKEGTTDIIHWNETGLSFIRGGVKYSDGKLSPGQSGYYYIFSQIKFRKCRILSEKIVTSEGHLYLQERFSSRLDHFMYRRSGRNGQNTKILESSKSACELPSPNDETTSTIGAVFYLEENDEIFVNTSHSDCLVPSKEGNHFGIYLT